MRALMSENKVGLEDLKFSAGGILELISLVDDGKISGKIAQEVFVDMFNSGNSPTQIVTAKGLVQVSDQGAIGHFCDEAIQANPKSVADYQAGKMAALNFLKGQVMKLSKGKANPAMAGEMLERKLNERQAGVHS